MKQILMIEASPRGEQSASRQIAKKLEEGLRQAHPEAKVVYRDLAAHPVPHLDANTVTALKSDGNAEALKLSDQLIDELAASDLLVIATPMWNFGVPSVLKAWIDHIARAGKTFSYSANGPVGLLTGKKAILVIASGGYYSDGPMTALNFVEPYLRTILQFIGIRDIETVRVEGLGIANGAETALPRAEGTVHQILSSLDPAAA